MYCARTSSSYASGYDESRGYIDYPGGWRTFLYAAAPVAAPVRGMRKKLLQEEVDREMALVGISTLTDMRRELLMRAAAGGSLRYQLSSSRKTESSACVQGD